MTCVLVLNSITGKNYDFLKLAMGYIFVFSGGLKFE